MTSQEVKLWVHLRSWRSRGFHFRRQVPRAGYIVDFACLRHKLIVEMDGSQHAMPPGIALDASRDRVLIRDGYGVIRFWNIEIDRNLEGVLQVIEDFLIRSSRPPTPVLRTDPPPLGEG